MYVRSGSGRPVRRPSSTARWCVNTWSTPRARLRCASHCSYLPSMRSNWTRSSGTWNVAASYNRSTSLRSGAGGDSGEVGGCCESVSGAVVMV